MTKIYVSPSTQERNIGVGDYGSEEKVMNELATYLIKKLQINGYQTERNNPSMTLAQVIQHSNKYKPDLHLALHSNAFNGRVRGCEVFCFKFNTDGHNQAVCIDIALARIVPFSRGVKQGFNFYGEGKSMAEVANTTSPSVLIEVGFHDNVDDAKWIKGNLDQLADAIVSGVNAYFSIATLASIDYKKMYNSLKADISNLLAKYK